MELLAKKISHVARTVPVFFDYVGSTINQHVAHLGAVVQSDDLALAQCYLPLARISARIVLRM